MRVLAAAGRQGMDSEELDRTFKERMGGLLPDEATAGELQTFLNLLEAGEAA